MNRGKRKRPCSPPSLPLRLQTRKLTPTLVSGPSRYFNEESWPLHAVPGLGTNALPWTPR